MATPLKIASWNVNGLRACIKNGFLDWLEKTQPDIVCLQETKITKPDFYKIVCEQGWCDGDGSLAQSLAKDTPLFVHTPSDTKKPPQTYSCWINAAQKPGYSGVTILSRLAPVAVNYGIETHEFDQEGRVIFFHTKKFTLVNCYIPNGGRELERIPFKLKFSDALLAKLNSLRREQKNLIICGDMNVAHQEIDIKNAKSNVKNSGFTPEERAWFSKFLKHDYVDVYRHKYPQTKDVYSWWSYRPGVREKNIGWRIDYFVVTKESLPHIADTSVEMAQRGSDHCPVWLEWRD